MLKLVHIYPHLFQRYKFNQNQQTRNHNMFQCPPHKRKIFENCPLYSFKAVHNDISLSYY